MTMPKNALVARLALKCARKLLIAPFGTLRPKKATKCDLCTNTPFFNRKGGVDGAQACVEACPKKVLKVVDKLPLETGGYEVDLALLLLKAECLRRRRS